MNTGITATNSANTTALTYTISASKLILGATQTWTVNNGGTVGTANLAVSGVVSGGFGLTKAGNGTLTLSGPNTYTGVTTLTAGTLSVGIIGNGGVAGNLGNATSAAGNIVFNGGTLQYTGSAATSDRAFTINAGKVATINTAADISFAGATGATTTGGLTKLGSGNLTLTGVNKFTGATVIDQGALIFTQDQTASFGTLTFGASTASNLGPITLDLTSANATYTGAMLVQNNTSFADTITIGSGKTLTTCSTVTVGNNVSNNVVVLTVAGAGTWIANNSAAAGVFWVGGGTTRGTKASINMSGLATFTANLSGATSLFRIGDNPGQTAAKNNSSMTLASTSTITVATLGINDKTTYQSGAIAAFLALGNVTNTINANTINIGSIGNGQGSGTLNFNTTTGTVKIRAQDTTGAAALNLVAISTSTSAAANVGLFDVSGHEADLLFSTVDMTNMAGTNGGAASSKFAFDSGNLTATTFNIGTRASGSTGTLNAAATVYIGGNLTGVASNLTNNATLGTVNMATQNSAFGTITGALNITGTGTTVNIGNLTVGNNTPFAGGTANATVTISGGSTTITGNTILAANSNGGTVNGSLIINGGTLTVGHDIVTANSGSGSNSTITLGGGTLDMGGHAIGGVGQLITNLNFNSGTLKNVSEINNGAGLHKNTAGTLTRAGTNSYTGGTTVSAGMLMTNLASVLPEYGTSGKIVFGGGTLGVLMGDGTTTGWSKAQVDTLLSNATQTSGALGIDTTNGSLAQNSAFTQANLGNALGLTKLGTNTLTLDQANTYAGNTTLTAGALNLSNQNAIQNSTLVMGGGDLVFDSSVGGNAFTFGGLAAAAAGSGYDISLLNNAGSPAAIALTVGGNNANTTYAGNLTGTGGSLIKVGTGTLTLSGTNTYSGSTRISNGTLSINSVALSGAAQSLGTGTVLDLGVAGTSSGRLLYTGGVGTFGQNINALGNGSDTIENTGTGLLTLSGTLTKDGTKLTIKGGGNGISVTGAIAGASANSDLIIDGGFTTLEHGNTYNGPTFIINGATLTANVADALPSGTRTDVLMDQTGSGTSTLALGADQAIASLTGSTTSVVSLGNKQLTVGAGSGNTTFSGVISGIGGSLRKDGASTLVLSGTNTYTGVTYVTAGTMIISATGNIASSSSVNVSGGNFTVDSGGNAGNIVVNGGYANVNGTALDITVNASGTLTGAGRAGAVVVNNLGTLAPGNTSGTFTASSLALQTGSTTKLSIASTPTYEKISITGSTTLAGTFQLKIDNALTNGTLQLFAFGNAPSGHFDNMNSSQGFYSAASWSRSNSLWTASGTGDQTLTFDESSGQLSVVPEAQTWILVGIGLTFLLYRRRAGRGRDGR